MVLNFDCFVLHYIFRQIDYLRGKKKEDFVCLLCVPVKMFGWCNVNQAP